MVSLSFKILLDTEGKPVQVFKLCFILHKNREGGKTFYPHYALFWVRFLFHSNLFLYAFIKPVKTGLLIFLLLPSSIQYTSHLYSQWNELLHLGVSLQYKFKAIKWKTNVKLVLEREQTFKFIDVQSVGYKFIIPENFCVSIIQSLKLILRVGRSGSLIV